MRCPAEQARREPPTPARLLPPGESPAPLRGAAPADFRHRLASTPWGWPRLGRWCVWVEPPPPDRQPSQWDQRWLDAVERALSRWQAVLPILRVDDPAAAHVRVLRQRPPLRIDGSGRTRASHGRATLEVLEVDRGDGWRLEPLVKVQLSPGQRSAALEATALHELGHAFGLWGHSDDPADAMAVTPGAEPVLRLSERDRDTILWLYSQPTRFGSPLLAP